MTLIPWDRRWSSLSKPGAEEQILNWAHLSVSRSRSQSTALRVAGPQVSPALRSRSLSFTRPIWHLQQEGDRAAALRERKGCSDGGGTLVTDAEGPCPVAHCTRPSRMVETGLERLLRGTGGEHGGRKWAQVSGVTGKALWMTGDCEGSGNMGSQVSNPPLPHRISPHLWHLLPLTRWGSWSLLPAAIPQNRLLCNSLLSWKPDWPVATQPLASISLARFYCINHSQPTCVLVTHTPAGTLLPETLAYM